MGAPLNLDERRGPLHRHNEGGLQVYLHPVTDERFISVTTVLDIIESEGLSYHWRPGLAAKAAFEELPRLVRASRIRACGRTHNRCEHDWRERCDGCPCGECKECVIHWLTYRHFAESRRRAAEGSTVHHWINDWVLSGGKHSPIDPELKPYTDSFLAFVADFGLTPDSWDLTEATILNREHGWGGTLDAHLRFDAAATPAALKLCRKFGKRRPVVTTDFKSREKPKVEFYPDNAKQLAAYCRGEVILLDDGQEEPLPPTDGGLVVQILREGYGWRRAVTDDATYAAFLANLESIRWETEHGPRSVQVRTFPDLDIPDLPQPVKAARKAAAPRKAATRKATAKATAPAAASRPAATAVNERPHMDRLLGLPTPHPDSPYGDEIPF